MPAAPDVASERFYWSSAGYLATEARSSSFHEASKVKPHSVVAHIIYEDMLDALDLNNVANEFVQDIKILNTDKAYFDTHAWLPWWMPRLHGACIGFKSPLGWDLLLYSINFEDCDSLLNRLSLLNRSL